MEIIANIRTLGPEEFEVAWIDKKDFLSLDVRSPAEFRYGHMPDAVNIPIDRLHASVDAVKEQAAGREILLVCAAGTRAKKAYQILHGAGVANLHVLEGGLTRKTQSGAISLERQVRIAAGLLVALGTLLGVAISPWFLIVPGFIGCGLAFAGITGTCGMGILLSKMSWNQ